MVSLSPNGAIITDEHRAKAKEEAAEILRRVLAGEDKPKKTTKPKEKKPPKPRGPKYDYERIYRLHNEGRTQVQIATELGCNPRTVHEALKLKYGVGGYPNNSHVAVTNKCTKGHSEWKIKADGRHRCIPCDKEYQANYYRNKKSNG